MADTADQLGAYLKSARESAGFTQAQVGLHTRGRVSANYVGQLELGRIKRPDPNKLVQLAHLYKLDREDLLRRAGITFDLPVSRSTEPVEEEAPVLMLEVDDFSPGLRDFLESDEAQLMRVSWSEVRRLLATRFYGGPRGRTADQWRRVLSDQREWENRSLFGTENPDDQLVWKDGNPPK